MAEDVLPKLLVVDDEPKNLHTIRRILEKQDIDIVFAGSGEEALREVLRHDFFLILMDVQMPDMNGLETSKLILANRKTAHLPIIFVTATSKEEKLLMEGYDAGAVDYIYKPVNPLVVSSKVGIFRELYLQSLQLKKSNAELTKVREALKKSNEELTHLAFHDSLTGLANRKQFSTSLSQAILRSDRSRKKLAVFFMDLDNFKGINDTLGHDAGDNLLKVVADRLQQSVRKNDLVSRFGGDEFAVLMENIRSDKDVAIIAEKILRLIGENINIRGRDLVVTSSIGIALYPDASPGKEQLLECADTAMYRAKKDGRNNYRFYSDELQNMAVEFSQMSFDLRRAMEREQLEVHYQPQIDATTGRVSGMEALVRWNHPEHGLVPAADFISVAEQSGLIRDMGAWVMEEACRQFQVWHNEGVLNYSHVTLSVNVSALQIRSGNLPEIIDGILERTGLSPDHLELEITESALIDDLEYFIQVLNQLVDQGITIAMDDFGTGFASYRHLQRLPIHNLKIDRSFIAKIQEDPRDLEIVIAMTTMAKALGLIVTAEGIELEEQASLLRDINCDKLQGYHFGRPTDAKAMGIMLKSQ